VPESPRAGVLTKRALVIASHSVERAALADGGLADAVVLAMFQRLPYFDREREVYARIARRAAVTVIGMVSTTRPDLPPGATPVLLDPAEPLAAEWSVVVLSPAFGATVIAHDLDRIDSRVTDLEAARMFRGRWGLRRDEAYAEVVRLRDLLGDRLPPVARQRIEGVLAAVADPAAVAVEIRAEAALRHLAHRLENQRAVVTSAAEVYDTEHKHKRDPATGLHTRDQLEAWAGADADTVGLGLIAVRVADLAAISDEHGARAEMHIEKKITAMLREDLRPVDRAARVGRNEFVVATPTLDTDTLRETANRITERLTRLRSVYPFVDVPASVTSAVTRRRPLPVATLFAQLADVTPDPLWPPEVGTLGPVTTTARGRGPELAATRGGR
jgi:GGDEF domain-containing protein